METDISEVLAQGTIHPSTSPMASGFFFTKKKDSGIRLCIDYWELNMITGKRREQLPHILSYLISLVDNPLICKARPLSTYNIFCVRIGDEWRTTFITSTGQFQYLVMLYGLVNRPVVFQSFMNEILSDILAHFVNV